MTAALGALQQLVDQEKFRDLFISELGWDNPTGYGTVSYRSADDVEYRAQPVAAKRGVVIYHCDAMPSRHEMESLDRAVAAATIERLIIFTGEDEQQWRWPEPRRAGGVRYVTQRHRVESPDPGLIQRLQAIRFALDEEADLNILRVRARVRVSFSADEVTSRFYNEFKENQERVRRSIEGISRESDAYWYSSLLVNRLMFIYFLQKKGFLNQDLDYLRSSLRSVQQLRGRGRFYEYYRDFLLPLFHRGLGAEAAEFDDSDIAAVMGDVPYINGGIFAEHELEQRYEIHVPDEVFEALFDFFDRYRWHLDERPTGDPNEINPEVLGYIFEQYVNQKAQGAYYTREDVTGYMAGMTIPPAVIERLESAGVSGPWPLLAANPRRYVPEGLLAGLDNELPPDVEAAHPAAHLLDSVASEALALPGERWREVVERRRHVEALLQELAQGAVGDCAAAVARNLNLQQLLLDWIAGMQSEEELFSVYAVLHATRILDPTCGSGAFLFAALDVVEELYLAIISKAHELASHGSGLVFQPLRELIQEVGGHRSEDFFIRKTIVLENLYGVDIMPEASEIARLRLFLSLAATLEDRDELEPMPDLDLNIRAGNALVGVASTADLDRQFGSRIVSLSDEDVYLLAEPVEVLQEKAAILSEAFQQFVEAQRSRLPASTVSDLKKTFQQEQRDLDDGLNALCCPYSPSSAAFEKWRTSHLPLHWFTEFPEAVLNGGFDVVLGNPPYVAKSKVAYSYSGFITDSVRDICAPCTERAASLVREGGWFALILPIAFQFSEDYNSAREAVNRYLPQQWVSAYSRNPAALFSAGLGVRSTIILARAAGEPTTWTTDLRRWHESGRQYLFGTNRYAPITIPLPTKPWSRCGTTELVELYESLTGSRHTLGLSAQSRGPSLGFKQTALYYLSVFVDDPPAWFPNGRRAEQTMIGRLSFADEASRDIAYVLLAGRLGVWWWGATGDDFHLTSGLLKAFPVSLSDVAKVKGRLLKIAARLRQEQLKHPLVTMYAGREMGNYDMSRCRHITDESDQLVLDALELGHLWPAVLLADDRLAKVTGERPGTRRSWPFPL